MIISARWGSRYPNLAYLICVNRAPRRLAAPGWPTERAPVDRNPPQEHRGSQRCGAASMPIAVQAKIFDQWSQLSTRMYPPICA